MADNDRIGKTIAYYRIERLLGRGGMATVYQATDERLQRQVALKIMHSHLASQEQFQQSFLREAEAIQSLDHPNIIKVYAFDQIDDELFIVMELIEGGGLRSYMKQLRDAGQRMEMPEAIELTREIADALHYAHQQGMIHRDVKPDNVLLRSNPSGLLSQYQAVLSDFGLAKLAQSGDIFITSQPVGTYPYMSPEQTRDERVDVRSDIYSLGIMFYELITGRLPFQPRSLAEATRMHTREPVPRPGSLRPGLPSSLEKIILKALEKDPNNRYQTAGDFSRNLQEARTNVIEEILNQPVIPDTDVDGQATNLIGEPPPEPMPQYTPQPVTDEDVGFVRVVIFGEDRPTQAIPLKKTVITLGRGDDRDIVLVGKGVSRRHARIERSTDGKYRIVDLRSTNGTWLEDARLIPNVAELWEFGKPIRIADYWLRLEAAASRPSEQPESMAYLAGDIRTPVPQIVESSALSPGLAAPAVAPAPVFPPSEREKIGLKVDNPVVRVEPGSSAVMQLTITNLTQLVEHFTIQVNGLPPDWVTTPPGTLELLPGDHDTASITFHPPRNSSSTAGAHALEVRVVARAQGLLSVATQGALEILPYPNFISELHPQRLLGRGIAELQITNTGNTYGTYNIYPRDKEQAIKFSLPGKQYTLPPGHTEYIDIKVKPKSRPLIGNTQPKPFEVSVTSRDEPDKPKSESGELVIYPYIPLWLIVGLALMLGLCLLVVLWAIPLVIHNNEVTQTAVAMAAGTSAAGTATANAPTVTPTATATATPTPTLTPFPTIVGSTGDICPGSPSPSQMQVGIVGRVTLGGLPNRLRDNPGKSTGKQIGLLQPGTVFSVIDGPQCDTVEQLRWWKVTASGAVGWTAEGERDVYYLEPLTNATAAETSGSAPPAMVALEIPPDAGSALSLDPARTGIQIHADLSDPDWDMVMTRVAELGVGWIKIQIAWREMQPTSSADVGGTYFQRMIARLKDADSRGLKILVSVAKAPDWTRANLAQDGPPDNPQALATFLTLFLSHAGDSVDAIEIWNEPNLSREWQGALPFDGAGYMSLFAPAYEAIRAVSPTITIITAGLAPTANSVNSVDDREYLLQMYDAGLSDFQDIAIGVHPYGWVNPPDAVCCGSSGWSSDSHFYFGDTIGMYRGTMVANAHESLPLFVTEFGWATWDGLPGSPSSSNEWMRLISEEQQSSYTLRAFQIGAANDFVGPMILWNLNFGLGDGQVNNHEEGAAFSLLHRADPNDPTNQTIVERALYGALRQALSPSG